MGIFSKILTKLGLKKPETEAASATMGKKDVVKPAAAAQPAPSVKPVSTPKPIGTGGYSPPSSSSQPAPKPVTAAAPAPMEMVDVMSKLETMAKGTGLNWKASIVDLLKVLDLDSSKEARKELAVELGCPPEQMKDPELRDMNQWLHKTVLAEIAKNGGNIPKELLD
jgi:Domain of unknown function (DUF3597)